MADKHGNVIAQEGCTRCACGAKYWENDVCASCGAPVADAVADDEPDLSALVARVVWLRSSPLRSALHRQGCFVLARRPASSNHVTFYDVTPTEVAERAAQGNPFNLCGHCGTKKEFS